MISKALIIIENIIACFKYPNKYKTLLVAYSDSEKTTAYVVGNKFNLIDLLLEIGGSNSIMKEAIIKAATLLITKYK